MNCKNGMIACLGWALSLALVAGGRAQEADQRLAVAFKGWLDEYIAMQPFLGTRWGDHRFANKLEDLSPAGREKIVSHTRKTLDSLNKEFDPKQLSPDGRVDLATWKTGLERSLWIEENLAPLDTDPRSYNEYTTDSTYLLVTQTTLPKAAVTKACLARIREVPRLLEQARTNWGAKKSSRPPVRVFVETAIRQVPGSIAWYKSGLAEALGQGEGAEEVRREAAALVPLFEGYRQFLEKEVLPRSSDQWKLGPRLFAQKLEYELEADISAPEVLAEAEREFARVESEMAALSRTLWPTFFPGKAQLPDTPEGRRETTRRVIAEVSRDRGTVDTLVKDAKNGAEKLKAFIRKRGLLKLPEPDRCDILEMPEFQRGNSVAYLNNAPPLDFEARSVYAISPPPKDWDARRVESFLDEYNHRMMQILTLHEAYPGHYVQLEYANRNPSLVRRIFASGVYIEGWAVHMEQVMLDEGYGDGDLGLRLLQLKWYLRAVANAILDNNMHSGDWNETQALRFMVDKAFQSEGEALGKVVRSKQSPCQLSTYFVGRTAMHRLRQKVQTAQGDKFALLPYHQAVLEVGAVPVRFLPQLVEARLGVGAKP
ncbi:MAG: DUF885 domain-containing protein [Gemmataceae bacterium]|nr:DUF885 domain-containing protein [Gemmataceae bacterium]